MTIAITSKSGNHVEGDERLTVTDVTFDSSYPTGGEVLNPSDLGLQSVNHAVSVVKVAGTGSVVAVHYSITAKKLLAYTATAEVTDTTDLSAVTAQVTAWGY